MDGKTGFTTGKSNHTKQYEYNNVFKFYPDNIFKSSGNAEAHWKKKGKNRFKIKYNNDDSSVILSNYFCSWYNDCGISLKIKYYRGKGKFLSGGRIKGKIHGKVYYFKKKQKTIGKVSASFFGYK